MNGILIVDDQPAVLQGVRKMLETDSNFSPLFLASDGEEALSIIHQHKPEILICDIMMPKLDGLGLLAKLHEENIKTKVIILSAYDDFSFAQKAISFKVDEYLIKPVSAEDLLPKLYKILDEIRKESREEIVKSQSELFYQTKVFMDFLSGDDIFVDVSWLYRSIGLEKLGNRFFSVCAIRHPEFSREREHAFTKQMESLEGDRCGILILQALRNLSVLIINSDDEENAAFLGRLSELLQSFSTSEAPIYSGVSSSSQDRHNLPQLYRQADAALKRCMFRNESFCIYKPESISDTFTISIQECDSVVELMKAHDENGLDMALDQIFINISYQNLSVDNIKNILFSFVNYVVMNLKDTFPNYKIPLLEKNSLDDMDTIFQLKNVIKTELNQCIAEVERNKRDESAAKPNDYIIRYIKKHLDEDISLSYFADKLGFNYFYLSNIFSKSQGVSFSEYLIQQRMERAKQLLEITSEKIYEISWKVGYKDVKHFCKTFKKYVQETPGDYRERVRNL